MLDARTGEVLVWASHVQEGAQFDVNLKADAPAASLFKVITGAARLWASHGHTTAMEAGLGLGQDDVAVVSPDAAGVSRASALAKMLGAPLVVVNKQRPEPNRSQVVEVVGNFQGKRCVMIDDMIDTGGSIINGAKALMERGATSVSACCTHAVFSRNASADLQASVIEEVVVLDTIPLGIEKQFPKLTVLPVAPLIADAIRRIYLNQSISALFNDWK
jgi:ribose-phosphate pyrophosphokinase